MSDPLGGNIDPFIKDLSFKSGFPLLISNLVKLSLSVGGLIVLFNLIFAGYGFLTAAGDPKKVEMAWNKIWQSIVGLIIIVSSLAIMSAVKTIFGIDVFNLTIYGPGGSSVPGGGNSGGGGGGPGGPGSPF